MRRDASPISIPCRFRRISAFAAMAILPSWRMVPGPVSQVVDQSEQDIAPYRNAKSYVGMTTDELMAAVPELKGLQPPLTPQDGENALAAILGRVGENVKEFADTLPDLSALEEISMERLRSDGRVAAQLQETFRYLVVARHGFTETTFEEYRTDLQGKAAEPGGLVHDFSVTKGFAYTAIHFHPSIQADSVFRYLGKQILDAKETDLVAFAQRPGFAHVTGRVALFEKSVLILVQGLAWIDPATYQIVRLRTDLLAPRTDVRLKTQTTDIRYAEFHLSEMPQTVWLPSQVTVTVEWRGKAYRNVHHYSDYKLFRSSSIIKF
jgi:hypothetical protein